MSMRDLLFVGCAALALSACMAPAAPAPIEFRTAANRPAPAANAPPAASETDEAAPFAAAAAYAAASTETPGVGGDDAAAPSEIAVAPGDTLFALAETHMVSLRALIDANALEPPFALQAGQRLAIPPPNTYVVQPGDTLYGVARRHSIHFRSLANLNQIEEPYSVEPGRSIILPGSARDWRATAAPASPPEASTSEPRHAARGSGAFDWPLDGAIVRGFGSEAPGRRNDGVNIAANEGDPVRAVADGRVVYVGEELAGYGQLLLIQHDDGWISAYAHNRAIRAAENAEVRRGDVVAEAGSTGAVETTQLHFELRRNGSPVDPTTVLPPRAS